MDKPRDDVCGCGCGYSTTNQPLLKLVEMFHRAEEKAKADAQRQPADPPSSNEKREPKKLPL